VDNFEAATNAAEAFKPLIDDAGGPFGLVGRAIGLGADEIQAGVPKWAWFGIGLVGGVGMMWVFRDRISAFADD
jgi:hypothetical protein